MAPSGGCLSPENRLRGTKLADPSGIRPKSLPRTFLGRRRPSRREVPLKQPVGDFENLGEIFPHIPVLQRGEKAGAAKAVNHPRPNGAGHNAIARPARHKSAKPETEGREHLRRESSDTGVNGPKHRS